MTKTASPAPIPYAQRLIRELDLLEAHFVDIIETSTIRYVNPNHPGGVVFVGAADWGWEPSDAAHEMRRARLLERYGQWHQRFALIFPVQVPAMAKRLHAADAHIRRWLERPDTFDHSIPRDLATAVGKAGQSVEVLRSAVRAAAAGGAHTTYLVPDTNALIDNPDLADYATAAGVAEGVVYLVPTVLGELDELKTRAHQDRRQAAIRAIRVIANLRTRGELHRGVAVAGKVTARAVGVEPRVADVLAILDENVPDDRIVASSFELQSREPASTVILITRDINLMTKADLLGLPYVPTPERVVSA